MGIYNLQNLYYNNLVSKCELYSQFVFKTDF